MRLATPVRALLLFGLMAAVLPLVAADAVDDSSVGRLKRDLQFLTSDECEGRGAETQGLHKAADYIAQEFKKLGLKPGGDKDTYFQAFGMRAGRAKMGTGNSMVLKGPLGQEIALKVDEHFRPIGLSASGKLTAPLVFAGFGVSDKDADYDDYKSLDAAGKIVVVLRKSPTIDKAGKPFAGGGMRQNQLGSLTNKLLTANTAKAAGVIFVNDMEPAQQEALMPFDYTSYEEPPVSVPCVHVTRTKIDAVLQSAIGFDLAEVEKTIRREAAPRSFPLAGWSAALEVSVVRKTVDVKNVIGILPGKGPLANETVILGAHYDHLGRGERGSLERDAKRAQDLHRGADDNGSGTVSILELARRFATRKDYQGRTLVFMTFAGEEQGLLGSRHFCNKPTVPLDKACAMVNFDMVGRLREDSATKKMKIEIGGVGSAKEFSPLLDEINSKFQFQISKTTSAFGPSDHTSFADKKVPVFFFFTGLHQEYHKPADLLSTINFEGMKQIVDFGEDLVGRLAQVQKRPEYVQTSRGAGPVRANVPRIGIMPGNYDEAAEKGVLIGGVTEGLPAAKAGIKQGDFIVEIGGKPVKNMTAYMTVMGLQKKGETVEFVVDRAGKKIKIPVKLE